MALVGVPLGLNTGGWIGHLSASVINIHIEKQSHLFSHIKFWSGVPPGPDTDGAVIFVLKVIILVFSYQESLHSVKFLSCKGAMERAHMILQ